MYYRYITLYKEYIYKTYNWYRLIWQTWGRCLQGNEVHGTQEEKQQALRDLRNARQCMNAMQWMALNINEMNSVHKYKFIQIYFYKLV